MPIGGDIPRNQSEYSNPELARLSGEISVLFKDYFQTMKLLFEKAEEAKTQLDELKESEIFQKKSILIRWDKLAKESLKKLYKIFNTAEEKLKEIKKLPATKEVKDKAFVLEFTFAAMYLSWDYVKENLTDLEKAVNYLKKYENLI